MTPKAKDTAASLRDAAATNAGHDPQPSVAAPAAPPPPAPPPNPPPAGAVGGDLDPQKNTLDDTVAQLTAVVRRACQQIAKVRRLEEKTVLCILIRRLDAAANLLGAGLPKSGL